MEIKEYGFIETENGSKAPSNWFEPFRSVDFWMNKIGMGLLLLGMLFLFKYGIDQGWLTPEVRVGMGLLAGMVMMGLGLRVHERRPHFGQVLLGGGIATYYLTEFAAFQLFELVSYGVSFGFMVGTTVLAFLLAIRQNESVLAVIGAIGGLATPFLLATDVGSVQGLMGYLVVMLAGIGAMYFVRGWRVLMTVASLGGWGIIGSTLYWRWDLLPAEEMAVMLGAVAAFTLTYGIVAAREVLGVLDPNQRFVFEDTRWNRWLKFQWMGLAVIAPVLSITTVAILGTEFGAGMYALGVAVVMGMMAAGLFFKTDKTAVSTLHGYVGVGLLAMATAFLLDGNALFVAISAEVLLLSAFFHLIQSKVGRMVSHLLNGLLLIAIAWRMSISWFMSPDLPIFNSVGLANGAVLAGLFAVSLLMKDQATQRVYWLLLHLSTLAYFAIEAASVDGGVLTLLWGVYAFVVLLVSLVKQVQDVQIVAILTVLGVVGKMVAVDMGVISAEYRVILFCGFGIIMLLISYFYRRLAGVTA